MELWLEKLPELLGDKPRTGILHIGAHDGREVPEYRRLGFGRIILVEPNPERARALRLFDGVAVVEAAIARTHGTARLYIPAHDEAASLLPPIPWPAVRLLDVATRRLDSLNLDGINVIVVDVQGAEVEVLSSGSLAGLDLVVAETTDRERYRGGAASADVDDLMARNGFQLAGRFPHSALRGLSDSAYTRR